MELIKDELVIKVKPYCKLAITEIFKYTGVMVLGEGILRTIVRIHHQRQLLLEIWFCLCSQGCV